MIKQDLSHWTISTGKSGLLLFAQAFEELIAPHSHDSYKVSALNFHYICHEVLNAIELIEDDVLDKGNFIPLWTEMQTLFQRDPIAQRILGKEFDALFYKKNNKGEFDKQSIKIDKSKDVESYLPTLKKGTQFIVKELGRNNQYYKSLLQEIKISIQNSSDDPLKLEPIFGLTRILASELINRGFSQAYIYDCIKQVFFKNSNTVDTIDHIDKFFESFSSLKHKYCVYLPLNSIKQKKAFEEYGIFKMAENVYEMFDPSIPYILKYSCEACDPYAARERTLMLANFCLSVNQFLKHNKYDYHPKYAEVVDTDSGITTFIRKPESALAQGYTDCGALEVNDLLDTCLGLSEGALQVLQLHSMALISNDSHNQLINLWTAIEVAIPVVRKDGLSRINQISNVLTAALGRNYFSSLITQLTLDIEAVNKNVSDKIQQIEYEGSFEEKLLAVLFLPQFVTLYDEIFHTLVEEAPLLAYKLHRYKVNWSSAKNIKNSYLSHNERLSQQIMRIYRTRNMLVHDGSAMPYTDYVLQNLHYYVDTFIRFLNSYYKQGYRSIQTLVDAVQFQEYQYLQSLCSDGPLDGNGIKTYILRKEC